MPFERPTRLIVFITGLTWVPMASGAGARIKSVTTLTSDGGRVDWSNDNRIAFDRRGADRYFNVYMMNPDGSRQQCLTCGKTQLPGKNAGNPAFHPTGRYIIFQAQKNIPGLPDEIEAVGNPGAGIFNDVWVMDDNGMRFWRMTNTPTLIGGVLHPKFSYKGDKVLWAERVDNRPIESFGTWEIKLADFVIGGDGTPEFRNVRTFRPLGFERFYETHGFSRDDSHIYFCTNGESNNLIQGMDEFMFDYTTQTLTNLTRTPTEFDEHAHPPPEGNHLAWMSTSGVTPPGGLPVFVNLKAELWLMHPDGSDRERLTFFNDPNWQFAIPGIQLISDFAWNPDGTRIVAYLVENVAETKGRVGVLDLEFNSTSVQSASFQGQTIAREAIMSIFGRGFSTTINPAQFQSSTTAQARSLPLPGSLAGSSVRIHDSAGRITEAPLFFLSPRQVNLLVPATVALGPATLNVLIADKVVSTSTIQIATVAPGLFTANQDGRGVPLAFAVRVAPNGSRTTTMVFQCTSGPGTCSPVPIDFGNADEQVALVLYGTGIRGAGSTVTATVGGTSVQVLYAGAQGEFVGLDQVNLLLPRSLAGRGVVEVSLNVAGQLSNPVSISIR